MTRIIRYSSSIADERQSLRYVHDITSEAPLVAIEVNYDADRQDVLSVLAKLAATVIEDPELDPQPATAVGPDDPPF